MYGEADIVVAVKLQTICKQSLSDRFWYQLHLLFCICVINLLSFASISMNVSKFKTNFQFQFCGLQLTFPLLWIVLRITHLQKLNNNSCHSESMKITMSEKWQKNLNQIYVWNIFTLFAIGMSLDTVKKFSRESSAIYSKNHFASRVVCWNTCFNV